MKNSFNFISKVIILHKLLHRWLLYVDWLFSIHDFVRACAQKQRSTPRLRRHFLFLLWGNVSVSVYRVPIRNKNITKTFKKRIESHLSKEIERMVNNKCSVPYCPVAQAGLEKRGKTRGNVTHFSFPKNPDLHAQWLAALNRENFTPTTSSRVCEIHFNREDFIPPKDPNKLHVVKRLKEHTIPTRHLGDGAGLEVLTQESLVMAGDMETVVTDGTVHYESIEQGIALRPSEIEQTIELEDGNVETIIVKVNYYLKKMHGIHFNFIGLYNCKKHPSLWQKVRCMDLFSRLKMIRWKQMTPNLLKQPKSLKLLIHIH